MRHSSAGGGGRAKTNNPTAHKRTILKSKHELVRGRGNSNPLLSKNKSKPVMKLKTCDQEQKAKCIGLVSNSVQLGMRPGTDVMLGFNSTMKLVHAGRAAAIVCFRDSPSAAFAALKETAETYNVFVVAFGKVSAEFAVTFGVKKLSSFAVPFATEDSESADDERSNALGISLDMLRDYLVDLGKRSYIAE